MTFQTPTTSVMQGLLLPLLASKSRCEGTGGQKKRCGHSKAGSWRVRADSLDYMRRQETTDRGWHRLSCLCKECQSPLRRNSLRMAVLMSYSVSFKVACSTLMLIATFLTQIYSILQTMKLKVVWMKDSFYFKN